MLNRGFAINGKSNQFLSTGFSVALEQTKECSEQKYAKMCYELY